MGSYYFVWIQDAKWHASYKMYRWYLMKTSVVLSFPAWYAWFHLMGVNKNPSVLEGCIFKMIMKCMVCSYASPFLAYSLQTLCDAAFFTFAAL